MRKTELIKLWDLMKEGYTGRQIFRFDDLESLLRFRHCLPISDGSTIVSYVDEADVLYHIQVLFKKL